MTELVRQYLLNPAVISEVTHSIRIHRDIAFTNAIESRPIYRTGIVEVVERDTSDGKQARTAACAEVTIAVVE
jgi:hypothetical protein